ncbi:hypothetical protein [Pseudomonas putida]|uniref:Uncharacterized protein n=1 Tax=Pseudomonas putida TaxID=303 RepID=A0A8I1EB32_PSEPU|nr:hypothetical protein [Pseudomonas putida]MBI6882485.1 hypothetical protein [Pseudomonas putida]
MRRRTFAEGVAVLIPFWILAEIFFAFVRDPLADTYTGSVYAVTRNDKGVQVVTPLKAKLKLDVVDTGVIYDRRPGVSHDGLRIEFTGADLGVLSRLGIPNQMLTPDGVKKAFAEPYCQASKMKSEKLASFFAGFNNDYDGGYTSYGKAFHMTFRSDAGGMNCGSAHLGVIDFNNVQFALDNLSPSGYVFANLTRDSHISFVQRMIMKFRFDRDNIKTIFAD